MHQPSRHRQEDDHGDAEYAEIPRECSLGNMEVVANRSEEDTGATAYQRYWDGREDNARQHDQVRINSLFS